MISLADLNQPIVYLTVHVWEVAKLKIVTPSKLGRDDEKEVLNRKVMTESCVILSMQLYNSFQFHKKINKLKSESGNNK